MTSDPEDSASRIDIDWVRTLAAALAAVSSAVLLSTLGAVGTVIGAALGSVVASVGTAIYAQGLARSKQRVARAQHTAMHRIALAQGEVRKAQQRGVGSTTGEAHLEQAESDLAAAERQLDSASETATLPPWRERLAALPWKRIGIYAAGIFLIAVVVISAFELMSGRSVSSYTGGGDSGRETTFFGGGSDTREREQREPRPEPSPAPSDETTFEPTPSPGGTSPTEQPSPSDDPGPADDPLPSETPTTPTPSPTAPVTPSPTSPAPTE